MLEHSLEAVAKGKTLSLLMITSLFESMAIVLNLILMMMAPLIMRMLVSSNAAAAMFNSFFPIPILMTNDAENIFPHRYREVIQCAEKLYGIRLPSQAQTSSAEEQGIPQI